MTLSFYVLRQVAAGVALSLGVIVTMILLVDMVELSRELGRVADISPVTLAWLSVLRAPSLAETTFPFIFLFGAMWGMHRLNRRSELVVLRAAGVSAWRFIGPGVVFALACGVLASAVINPLAARLNVAFEHERDRITVGDSRRAARRERAIWLRERGATEQTVIRAGSASPSERRLTDVTMFIYDLDTESLPSFRRRLDAREAVLRAGFWQLRDAWESAPDVEPEHHDTLALPTDIEPSSLLESRGGPRTLNFWELPNQTRLLREAGFSSVQYELRWHRLLAMPFTFAAMTLVASAACLRLSRRGGALQLSFIAAGVGFAVYFGDSMMAALGSTSVLPSFLAAWTAPILTLLGGLFVIASLEDG